MLFIFSASPNCDHDHQLFHSNGCSPSINFTVCNFSTLCQKWLLIQEDSVLVHWSSQF
jgi:hypothetical protein